MSKNFNWALDEEGDVIVQRRPAGDLPVAKLEPHAFPVLSEVHLNLVDVDGENSATVFHDKVTGAAACRRRWPTPSWPGTPHCPILSVAPLMYRASSLGHWAQHGHTTINSGPASLAWRTVTCGLLICHGCNVGRLHSARAGVRPWSGRPGAGLQFGSCSSKGLLDRFRAGWRQSFAAAGDKSGGKC